jgi:hypothetical protein
LVVMALLAQEQPHQVTQIQALVVVVVATLHPSKALPVALAL